MASQWTKIASKNKNLLLRVAKGSFKTAGQGVLKRTPIDTGKFKEHWVTAIGKPIISQGTMGAGLLPVANILKLGQAIFFTNSLPYNFRLEFGWSNQAPFGMVRITIADWQGIVDREVMKFRNIKVAA